MGRRRMVEGRVATLLMDEAANRARFTVENDAAFYDSTMQYARYLTIPGVFVNFYHEHDIAGVKIVEGLRIGNVPLPDDAALDAALYDSLHGELTIIASAHRSPAFVEACGDAGPRMIEISERARELLELLDSIQDARSDPSPSNPALLPIYRELKSIGAEFGSIVLERTLFGVLHKDDMIASILKDASSDRFWEVSNLQSMLIDPTCLPTRRFRAREALEAFEAANAASA